MDWLEPLSQTFPARALILSPTLYLLVNAAHIMAIGVLFGAILSLDLRILGLARMLPLAPTAVYLSRLAATGLGLAMLTGLGLFSVRPGEYAANPAFLAKLALIALGLINILAVHLTPAWRATTRGAEPTKVLRVGAAISILIWGGAIIAGRWIGFI